MVLLKGESAPRPSRVSSTARASTLSYLHNGELHTSGVYRDDAQLQASAAAKRNDLLSRAGLFLARWRGDVIRRALARQMERRP